MICLALAAEMRGVPPSLLFLLASSTAGSLTIADELAPATNVVSTPTNSIAPVATPPPASAQSSEPDPDAAETIQIEPLTGEGEAEQSFADGITYFRHGVVVRYKQMELVAKQFSNFMPSLASRSRCGV